jgi:hypothetical protein
MAMTDDGMPTKIMLQATIIWETSIVAESIGRLVRKKQTLTLRKEQEKDRY